MITVGEYCYSFRVVNPFGTVSCTINRVANGEELYILVRRPEGRGVWYCSRYRGIAPPSEALVAGTEKVYELYLARLITS